MISIMTPQNIVVIDCPYFSIPTAVVPIVKLARVRKEFVNIFGYSLLGPWSEI